ncbi:MAG: hypothetical protein JW734_07940 [Candidatus Omnitrophica bacterium]|nr:hypothetical protein [Candidatus Omnitrophota bacterium]
MSKTKTINFILAVIMVLGNLQGVSRAEETSKERNIPTMPQGIKGFIPARDAADIDEPENTPEPPTYDWQLVNEILTVMINKETGESYRTKTSEFIDENTGHKLIVEEKKIFDDQGKLVKTIITNSIFDADGNLLDITKTVIDPNESPIEYPEPKNPLKPRTK